MRVKFRSVPQVRPALVRFIRFPQEFPQDLFSARPIRFLKPYRSLNSTVLNFNRCLTCGADNYHRVFQFKVVIINRKGLKFQQDVSRPIRFRKPYRSTTNNTGEMKKAGEEKIPVVNQDSTVKDVKEEVIKSEDKKLLTMDDVRKIFWDIEKKTYTQKELAELKEFLLKFLVEKGS